MVFGAITSYVKVMPSHIIKVYLKIATAEHLKILKEFLLLWKKSDPLKLIERVITFCALSLNVWSSSSPDLNTRQI